MKVVNAEKIIEENLGVLLYPITLVKFLLNRQRILSLVQKVSNDKLDFPIEKYSPTETCNICYSKRDTGLLCRKHTSIYRVLEEAKKVAFDLDTNLYFYKNEIFRLVDNKLIIVYCPHTKLINPPLTNQKIQKISSVVVETDIKLPEYEVVNFTSSEYLSKNIRCWVNIDFSLITIPNDQQRFMSFNLVLNN